MSNQSSYRSAEGTPSFLGHHTPSTQTPTRDAETSFRSNESVIESAEEAYGKKLFDFVLADAIFCAASGKEFNDLYSAAVSDFSYNACIEKIKCITRSSAPRGRVQDDRRALMGVIGAAVRQGGRSVQQEIAAIIRVYRPANTADKQQDYPLPTLPHNAGNAGRHRLPSPPNDDGDTVEEIRPWPEKGVPSSMITEPSCPGVYTSMLNLWMHESGTNVGHRFRWSEADGWEARLNVQGVTFRATAEKKHEAKHGASKKACEFLVKHKLL